MPRETLIHTRRGTYDEWALANSPLELGEPALETDTGSLKIGDGIHSYNDLPYAIHNDYDDLDIELVSQVETFLDSATATTIVAPAATHTKGNLILVFIGSYDNTGDLSVTDTQGNTYTPAGTQSALPLGVTGNWFWTYAQATGENTVTGHCNGAYRTIKVLEYRGFSTENPIDVVSYSSGETSAAFTTSSAKELILAAWHIEGTNVFSPNQGYELLYSGSWGTSNVRRLIEQKISSTIQTGTTVTLNHTAGTVYGSWIIALRQKPPIKFTTTGQTFAPIIKTAGDCTVTWTFSDGTTSNSLTPSKDFGTAATRVQSLEVVPWSALTQINVGYDGADGGTAFNAGIIDNLAQQNVSNITGLRNVAKSLKQFAASYNAAITTLDFKNFLKLEVIECYHCTALTNIIVTNTPKLGRLCVETDNISVIDLSTSPEMGDLRGSFQNASTFRMVWGSINKMWHICIQYNAFTAETRDQPWEQFPLVREIWFEGNNATQAEIDHLFAAVDGFGTSWAGQSPFIHAAGENAAPSAEGLVHVNNLIARGWTITHV